MLLDPISYCENIINSFVKSQQQTDFCLKKDFVCNSNYK